MMLEVLAKIPGRSKIAYKYSETDIAHAAVLLRGFKGELRGFKEESVVDEHTFWLDFAATNPNLSDQSDTSVYQQQILEIIDRIQLHEVNKVVLSRPSHLYTERADAQATFAALQERYSNCTVFALKHPDFGHWMGASPEVLFEEIDGGYRSMSLAGTRLSGALNWGDKEREEQNFVTEEIHKTLDNFGGLVRTQGEETLNAGPVEHLMTWVVTDAMNAPAVEVLEALHPTPAICGTPTAPAREVIESVEHYDRGLYTGYLAFMTGGLHATVLLRTMQWSQSGITFYAGGGITKDSVPLNEWMETEYKISALKDAVQFK
jgi:isochorismate synthase